MIMGAMAEYLCAIYIVLYLEHTHKKKQDTHKTHIKNIFLD